MPNFLGNATKINLLWLSSRFLLLYILFDVTIFNMAYGRKGLNKTILFYFILLSERDLFSQDMGTDV